MIRNSIAKIIARELRGGNMPKPKATCPHCGKSLTPDAKGRFRLHRIVWVRPKGSDCPISRSSGPCGGSFEQAEKPTPEKETT